MLFSFAVTFTITTAGTGRLCYDRQAPKFGIPCITLCLLARLMSLARSSSLLITVGTQMGAVNLRTHCLLTTYAPNLWDFRDHMESLKLGSSPNRAMPCDLGQVHAHPPRIRIWVLAMAAPMPLHNSSHRPGDRPGAAILSSFQSYVSESDG